MTAGIERGAKSKGKKKIMRKRIFSFAVCAVLFALGSSTEAQQVKKVPRIGYFR